MLKSNLPIVVAALVACSPEGVPYDEGGPGSYAEPRWAIGARPEISIGSTGTDTQFGRVSGALHLPNGHVVVADEHDLSITLFDPDGQVLQRAGGRGDGPGEYQHLAWIQHFRGDSVVAWDHTLVRATVYDHQLALGRVVAIPDNARGALTIPFGILSDASIIALHGFPRITQLDDQAWEQMDIVRFPTEDGDPNPVLTLSTKRCAELVMTSCPPPVLGYTSYFASTTDGVVIADASGSEVAYVDSDGGTRWTQQRRGPTRRVTAADRAMLRGRGDEKVLPVPDQMPYFLALLTGREAIWIKTDLNNTWEILGDTGMVVGSVGLPASFQPFDVSNDFVVGVAQDDLGVETVQVFRLERPSVDI